jgi:hypothetical protein
MTHPFYKLKCLEGGPDPCLPSLTSSPVLDYMIRHVQERGITKIDIAYAISEGIIEKLVKLNNISY